jgi:tetratricopeptide (TPR) repeat protein
VNYLSNVIRALQRNPERTSEFYSLYGGPDFDRNELIPDGIIDVHRIRMICNMNSFAWGDNEMFVPLGSDYFDLIPHACGMAIMASYANHSCFYNVERLMFGDMIMFVCQRDIGTGEEITISYNRDTWDNRWSITIGARQALHHWFPKCDCLLCQLMTTTPSSGRIQEILALADVPIGCEEDFVSHLRLYEELTEIYRDYPTKPFLDQFALMIGNEYFDRKEFERAMAYYEAGMNGTGRLESRVLAAFSALETAFALGNRRKAAEILAQTYEMLRVIVPFDFHSFLTVHRPLLKFYCPLSEEKRAVFVKEARHIWAESHPVMAPT